MAVYNIGNVSMTPISRDNYYVGAADREDIFEVQLGGGILPSSNSTLNLNLHEITPGQNVTLQLYGDVNRNGRWDSQDLAAGPIVSSGNPGSSDESINYRGASGTYFVRTYNYASSEARYNLDFSGASKSTIFGTNPPPSNLLPKEIEVGMSTSDRNFASSVSNSNTMNTYAFSIDKRVDVGFGLNGSRLNTAMRLIRDANNNRIVESGEIIESSSSTYTGIVETLDPGSYYLQVYQSTPNTSTNYSLTMDHNFVFPPIG